jgi:hypothetical protein
LHDFLNDLNAFGLAKGIHFLEHGKMLKILGRKEAEFLHSEKPLA